ncbi:DUF29 domain-containing protein [Desulfonema magnum]|uniref:DUF29 n=1 Tax=Desulfonema magnum TaxID=45655 RepID=A0A975BPT9_9BACT|nr:DUF29 domain-containing protein [Desulfonema magnum]QTA88855.1 DUF29 [Desulfonema magnum]
MNNLAAVYDQDFYLWLCQNTELLREGRIEEIDIENIAEELDAMGKSQHRELLSRLRVLFAHLLKWQFQPDHRSGSWKGTILEQRYQIEQLLEMSPSLKHKMEQKISKAYNKAVGYAAAETGISKSVFPKTCPYVLEEALDEDFYPEA